MSRAARAPVRDALLLGVVTAGLLLALQPRILWGPDAATLFMMLRQGSEAHWFHLLYVPIARLVALVGEAAGLDPFRASAAASALGVALAVTLLHRVAAGLGASRRESLATAILAGTAPAVVFFGLVIEVQGLYLAFSALAWLATIQLIARPSALRVVLLGLATGLAAMAHMSAWILPILVATFALTRIPRPELNLARLSAWATVGAIAHATPLLFIELTTDLPALETLGRSFGFANTEALEGDVNALGVLWSEWLQAFAPIAITAWAGLRVASWRRTTLWLSAPLALYLFFAWRVLSPVQPTEHGAYLLPFAFPFAWLTVRGLGARHAPWVAAIAILMSALVVRSEVAVEPSVGEAAASVVAAVDDPRGVVVLVDESIAEAVLIESPDMWVITLRVFFEIPALLTDPGVFDERLKAVSGRTFAFEQSALAEIERLGVPLARHLRQSYALEHRTADGFTVVVVR